MGQSRPLFLFIFVVSICHNLNWKKRRWCAWDSNPGRQDGRRERIHWATAAPLCFELKHYLWRCLSTYLMRIAGLNQCDQRCWNFATLQKFRNLRNNLRVYLVLGKPVYPLWCNLYALGQIFIAVNGKVLENNLAIWSHCRF